MPHAPCRLCGTIKELQLSHILPAFVFRWLRESAGDGYLRSTIEPNKRVQDGVKEYWLCSSCEQRFGKSEKLFADRLFYPYVAASKKTFRYSEWLLYFCTSVSWRVLQFYMDEDRLKHLNAEELIHVTNAERMWRGYLLGNYKNTGAFQQHMLIGDQIASATGELAPSINRYLMRAIHLDFCQGNKCIFTYAKLCRFMIFGFIYEPDINLWKGTKVYATHGFVEPKTYKVPHALAQYWNDKASDASASLASISDRQKERVNQAFRKNVDQYVGSDAFRAMKADVEMFGDKAFAAVGKGKT